MMKIENCEKRKRWKTYKEQFRDCNVIKKYENGCAYTDVLIFYYLVSVNNCRRGCDVLGLFFQTELVSKAELVHSKLTLSLRI